MTNIDPEERALIRDGFKRLLSDQCGEDDVRRTMESDKGFDPRLWQAMGEMGIIGLLVDPDFGGIGAGPVEIEMIMEEAGSALLGGPLLSSAVIVASLILASDDDDTKARLLPQIASGEKIATAALTGEKGSWLPADVSVQAEKAGESWELSGTASFVTFANVADILLVAATTLDGLKCFEIETGAAGVVIEPLETWDPSLRLSRISFSGAKAAILKDVGPDAFDQALDVARVALAGEQAGAARRIFDITTEYIMSRVQFGRPVGGFQAIKHMAADLLIEVESATSAARAAARALADDAPDKKVLINLAAFACADAFSEVAATSIQMHGGIAFTWEHVAHLYLRRARANAQLFGSSDHYREQYVTALEKAA